MKMIVYLSLMAFSINLFSEDITLSEAVKKVIESDNLIKSYYYKIEKSKYKVDEVNKSRFGMLNLKAMYTRGDEPVYFFASKMRQGDFSMADMMIINNPPPIENTEFGVEYGIPLFTGFKLKNYENIMKQDLEANRKMLNEVENGLRFKTIYQYLNVLMRKHLVDIVNYGVETSVKELESAEKLKNKGMIMGSDYYAALSIFYGLKNYKAKWEDEYRIELDKLKIMMGLKDGEEIQIKGKLNYSEFELKELDYYLKKIDERKMIKIFDDYTSMAEYKLSIDKNSVLPQINSFFSFNGYTGSIDSLRTSYMYGIKIDVPVGNPTYFSKINQTKAEIKEIGENKKDKYREIKTNIEEAYKNVKLAEKSINITSTMVKEAEKSLELFIPLYRQGKQSIMEVLRAEKNLVEAKAMYYEALMKYNLYYVKLMYESGMIDGNFIEKFSSAISK